MRALICAAALAAATAAHAQRHLSVDEAVQLALATNPHLRSVGARAEGSRDLARSTRGRLLPSVHVTEEWLHYDSPFALPFMGLTFPVRDQNTNSFLVSADQPVVGLLRLSQDYLAQQRNADAADAQSKAAESQMKETIRVGYLRYFEAKALEQIARSSEAELNEQVTVAQAKVKAGVLTEADLLRVQVAAANARLQEIVARTQGDTARAQLLGAVGFAPDDASVVLDEPRSLLAGAHEALPAYADAAAQARRVRPELVAGRLALDAAEHTRWARLFALLPDFDVEAAYLRLSGQKFAPVNQEYVGVRAQWAIWEWGATFYQERAAKLQAQATAFDLEDARRGVATEVKTSIDQSEQAASAVDVAQKTIASAEEAYRVMDAQVKAGTATTTDLLDAQSALTQARLNLARAQYEEAIARVSLARAVGD
jgi:outer membrane protein TolC